MRAESLAIACWSRKEKYRILPKERARGVDKDVDWVHDDQTQNVRNLTPGVTCEKHWNLLVDQPGTPGTAAADSLVMHGVGCQPTTCSRHSSGLVMC